VSRDDARREVVAGEAPLDRRLDRRDFLSRVSTFTALATAGGLAGVWTATPAAGRVVASGGAYPRRPHPAGSRPLPTRIHDFTVTELAAALESGELSAVEVVEALLARIDDLEPTHLAFNTVVAEAARASAREADARRAAGRSSGPLHGVPLAIKDNFFTAGVPTTANSHIFADFVPEYDAEPWARLRSAGAILLGKTQMGPLATSAATTPDGEATTRNAWAPDDRTLSPGGSSSGSATSVASGMAPGATGTQTGGSIVNPANSQGLTGLKPTMGRVSLRGIIPLTYTRDHPGPIARDAQDAALLLQAMAGPDAVDPRTLGLPPVPDLVEAATPVERGGRPALRWPTRIGVVPDFLADPPAPPDPPGEDASEVERRGYERTLAFRARREASARARRDMLDTFRELGAELVDVELPEDWGTLTSGAFNNVRLPERTEPFLEVLREDVRKFGVSLSPWINGLLLPGAEYLRGQRAKFLLLQRVLDDLFAECDVVVQTSAVPFDIIGLPEIAFPIGMEARADGREVPVGTILGGLPFAEDRLLSLVAAYQSVTDWHRRRPAEVATAVGTPGESPAPSERPPLRIDLETVADTCE
jgi:Asp-tRNA(Asn)/Glu-tRNA(Gln) amidotransferase A subunit family amidase